VQKELGNKKGARETAETCIKLATEANNQDYVRSGKELVASL